MEEKIKQLANIIKEGNNIVFFGGAGVSTESGIPDFRSVDGLYGEEYDYPPEYIISHTFYKRNPKEFYRFYFDKMIFPNAPANAAHIYLADLEKRGKLRAVVTQNIDGLHQKAGSKIVYELHGSVLRNYCEKCAKFYSLDDILTKTPYPVCDKCNGIIKPDVVLYEEGLPVDVLENSIKAIAKADVLIVGGTSLKVYPAAGLINYFNGDKLVIINKTPSPADYQADLVINGPIGEVFKTVSQIEKGEL